GARLVGGGFHEILAGAAVRRAEVAECESALGPDTAGVLYIYARHGPRDLEALVTAGHRRGVPVRCAPAGAVPPLAALGRLTAPAVYPAGRYDSLVRTYRARLQHIAESVAQPPAVCTLFSDGDDVFPLLEITVDAQRLGRNAFEVCRRLRQGDPPIYVGHG